MYYQTKTGTPSAYITKDRKRLKQFGQTVYLNNGEEFELELFNPSPNTVLSKIKLDGKYIPGGGIVLKPGQRVFLERYLDDPRKFKFETYNVDGSSQEVLDAIQNNGDVTIEFYDEYIQPVWTNNINNIYYGGSFGGPTYVGRTTNFTSNLTNTSPDVSFTTTSLNTNISSTTSSRSFARNFKSEVTMDSFSDMETGRVEKGGASSQSFQLVDKTFNTYTCSTSKWRILPSSQKIFSKQDLKTYCGSCGKRRKKDSDKFCSSCGNKF